MSSPVSTLPFQVAESITRGGTTFEVLEYGPLAGSEPFAVAEQVYILNRAGGRLRQLRVRLSSDAVRTEPGALQFLKGAIEMESSTGAGSGLGGLMKGALAAARTGETLFKPLYRGSGELYLEPTFGHFWLRQMEGETLYADQGLFFCCEDSVKVEAHKVESFSARMAGGEGRYQARDMLQPLSERPSPISIVNMGRDGDRASLSLTDHRGEKSTITAVLVEKKWLIELDDELVSEVVAWETARFFTRLADAIAGTEGAQYPFFSPDGRWLGVQSHIRLLKDAPVADIVRERTASGDPGDSGRPARRNPVMTTVGTCALSARLSGWKTVTPLIPQKNNRPSGARNDDPALNSLLWSPSWTSYVRIPPVAGS